MSRFPADTNTGTTPSADMNHNGDVLRASEVGASILRGWRRIMRTILVVAILATAYWILRPTRYSAEARLVPAKPAQSELSLLTSKLEMPFRLPNDDRRDTKTLIAIAESRSLADSMIQRVSDGGSVPGVAGEIRHTLRKHTKVKERADGSIEIEVRDRDAERAAQIANMFAPLLNQLVTALEVQVTKQKLDNLNVQLEEALARLQQSETKLVEFRQAGSAPIIEAQAKQTVEAAGEVQRLVLEQEMKIAQMRRVMTPANPELRAAVAELASLRLQLDRLASDRPAPGNIFIPMRAAPGIRALQLRFEREFARDEQVYIALAASVAQTQIDMNNRIPVVSVLDSALTPTAPAGLPLRMLLPLAVLVGLFIGIALTLWAELWRRTAENPETRILNDAWSDMKRELVRRLPLRSRPAHDLARPG